MSTATRLRRSRWAGITVLAVLLVALGSIYAAVNSATRATASEDTANTAMIEEGRQLFIEGCSSCHGLNAEGVDPETQSSGGNGGPSLIGVGSAAVHFQVSTGRMPLAGPEAQAPVKTVLYTPEEIEALSAYIASLAPGPASPTEEELNWQGASVAEGGELFRTNCSQCHNFSGKGGALSDGAYAPSLMDATDRQIWEAMLTGPQQMPVFSDETLTPEDKQAILAYINELRTAPDPGGQSLGSLGPVTEGIFVWVVGLGLVVAVAIWIGAKVR